MRIDLGPTNLTAIAIITCIFSWWCYVNSSDIKDLDGRIMDKKIERHLPIDEAWLLGQYRKMNKEDKERVADFVRGLARKGNGNKWRQ